MTYLSAVPISFAMAFCIFTFTSENSGLLARAPWCTSTALSMSSKSLHRPSSTMKPLQNT